MRWEGEQGLIIAARGRLGTRQLQTSVTFVGDLPAVRNSGMSVIAMCPQTEIDCIVFSTNH